MKAVLGTLTQNQIQEYKKIGILESKEKDKRRIFFFSCKSCTVTSAQLKSSKKT